MQVILASTGSVGDCFGNATAESLLATLECEPIDRRAFPAHAEARTTIFAAGRHDEEVYGGGRGCSKVKLIELQVLQVT